VNTRRSSDTTELTREELVRYSRHILLPNVGEGGQRALKKSRVLLVGAGLLLASFQRLRQVDLGVMTPERVLTFDLNLPEARYDSFARGRFYEEFDRRGAALHGVRAAGGVSKLPATGPYNTWSARALTGPLAGTVRDNELAEERVVSGDYFKAMGIAVVKGRAFDARDDEGAYTRGAGLSQRVNARVERCPGLPLDKTCAGQVDEQQNAEHGGRKYQEVKRGQPERMSPDDQSSAAENLRRR